MENCLSCTRRCSFCFLRRSTSSRSAFWPAGGGPNPPVDSKASAIVPQLINVCSRYYDRNYVPTKATNTSAKANGRRGRPPLDLEGRREQASDGREGPHHMEHRVVPLIPVPASIDVVRPTVLYGPSGINWKTTLGRKEMPFVRGCSCGRNRPGIARSLNH